ncbi:MAG: hypothetical protein ABI286_03990 [Edaphobacter sp.]
MAADCWVSADALDELTEIFLERKLLEPSKAGREAAAGGVAVDVLEQAFARRVQDLRDDGWRQDWSGEWGA